MRVWTYGLFIKYLEKWLLQRKPMKIVINIDEHGGMNVDVELKNLTALDMLTEVK